jgi:branched-chain amino acid transport system permease protein
MKELRKFISAFVRYELGRGKTMTYFLQQLFNALGYGSVLAVLSAGYTMTFGVIGLVNFAHGEVFMLGSFAAYFVLQVLLLPFWWGIIAALAGSVGIGLLVQRIAFKPIRGVQMVTLFITSLGASIVLRNTTVLLLNDRMKPFPLPTFLEGSYSVGDLSIYKKVVFIFLIALSLCTLIIIVVKKTKIGIAMRSIAYNMGIAQTLGINTERVIVIVFAISSALAGIAGFLWGLLFGSVRASMGFLPVNYAFIATILGGAGNVLGSIVGGLIIAIGSSLLISYLPKDYVGLSPLFAWIIFFSVLLLKPSGIFRANMK